ncbi:MAG: hypothetical protein JEZ08_11760 [Clostridiales bacterium]|nr:hypothetical protein [Clostridiales bacterium]
MNNIVNMKSTAPNPYLYLFNKKRKDVSQKYVTKDMALVKTENLEDVAIKNKIAQLAMQEKAIISHEKMHLMVGGNLASGPSYIYTTGPDGKRYIAGGQVNMKMPSGGSLDSLLSGLKRIKNAATAVGNPSGTDLNTAATAAAIESAVLKEMALRKMNEAYSKSREQANEPKIDNNMTHIDMLIEKSYVSKLSTMKFRVLSKFELLI